MAARLVAARLVTARLVAARLVTASLVAARDSESAGLRKLKPGSEFAAMYLPGD